jgi:hypothetical protein
MEVMMTPSTLCFLLMELWVDIYGEDDNDYAVPHQDVEQTRESHKDNQALSDVSSDVESASLQRPTVGASDALHSLPPKPPSPNSGSLSYSAQIAQQFSAYQQTPSQERQQRTESLLSKRPSTFTTNEGPSSAGSLDTVFGKKPSEMHDAGYVHLICSLTSYLAPAGCCLTGILVFLPSYLSTSRIPNMSRYQLRYFVILLQ